MCLAIKKVNNLITEARIVCLKQSENNERFSSLRLISSTANKLQKTAARGEGRMHQKCWGR